MKFSIGVILLLGIMVCVRAQGGIGNCKTSADCEDNQCCLQIRTNTTMCHALKTRGEICDHDDDHDDNGVFHGKFCPCSTGLHCGRTGDRTVRQNGRDHSCQRRGTTARPNPTTTV